METKTRTHINENEIEKLLNKKGDKKRVEEIFEKALEMKGLDLEESAVLLNIEDKDLLEQLFGIAKQIKENIYGSRIVMFAPMYLTNCCTNNCLYCGFRRDNKDIIRKTLTVDEALEETKAILDTGHKRLLLVAGEDDTKCNLDYLQEVVEGIYGLKRDNGEIRRINVNIAPLTEEKFRRLATFNLGTFQSFQETYHRKTYKKMHPTGMKANYDFRVETMDRAMEAGLKDVGMGVLFGLADYKFDTLALLMHSHKLDEKFGAGPHTLSIPRLEPAAGSTVSVSPEYLISDDDFKKIVAILRLSVPYTGMVLSTREKPEFRAELIGLGLSQISAGSKTNPGGYTAKESVEQFEVGDTRTIDEVIYELCQNDYIPSFCTGCYRKGRVGKDFMDLAKPGLIKRFCEPNAMLTFKEYLEDYASEKTKDLGLKVIGKHLSNIEDEKLQAKVKTQLSKIEGGERDIYM